MKTIFIAMALIFSMTSVTAFACPKGTHLVGGTGANHKGGKCVAGEDAKALADTKTSDAKAAVDTKAKAAQKDCDAKATEKKLAGAAKNSFTKKCMADAPK